MCARTKSADLVLSKFRVWLGLIARGAFRRKDSVPSPHETQGTQTLFLDSNEAE